jgi:hypothetical protein
MRPLAYIDAAKAGVGAGLTYATARTSIRGRMPKRRRKSRRTKNPEAVALGRRRWAGSTAKARAAAAQAAARARWDRVRAARDELETEREEP